MITLKRDNVVKQTESEVVALALESQGFVREGAAKKAAPENEAPAAEKELKGGTGGGQKPERCAETGTGRCERPA